MSMPGIASIPAKGIAFPNLPTKPPAALPAAAAPRPFGPTPASVLV